MKAKIVRFFNSTWILLWILLCLLLWIGVSFLVTRTEVFYGKEIPYFSLVYGQYIDLGEYQEITIKGKGSHFVMRTDGGDPIEPRNVGDHRYLLDSQRVFTRYLKVEEGDVFEISISSVNNLTLKRGMYIGFKISFWILTLLIDVFLMIIIGDNLLKFIGRKQNLKRSSF
jgi:hypothetical protein